jgi:DNA polymerase-3 subunit delta'
LSLLAGQGAVAQRLSTLLSGDRLHHALLFEGPDGVGKYTAARLFAQAMLCQSPSGADACGRCPSCVKMATGHPDVLIMETEEKLHKVDTVREVNQALHLRPTEGRFRILIIRDAEKMNMNAQNALLKTLEEPPGAAHIILTTARPRLLLPTVLSRCLKVAFLPVPRAEIAALLSERLGLAPEPAQVLAALAGGAPGRALAADPEAILALRDRAVALDGALDPGGPGTVRAALAAAESMNESPESLRETLDLLGVWLRDQLLVATTGDHSDLANADKREELQRLATARGTYEILRRARARITGSASCCLLTTETR